MGAYTGSDKRLKYLFENGGGGSANIWTGTKAEYEAQASQIVDGTQVNITDDEIQSLIVSSYDVYSTEEKEVGVWVDGKPLYQKTIDFGALPNNTSKSVSHGIANIEKIVHAFGIGVSATSFLIIPFVTVESGRYQVGLEVSTTDVKIYTDYNRSSLYGYVTIQYTKTTDVAGSGIFVPSGAGSVHYSTTEQVIGTWINGKPLYRKTFYIANSVTLNAQYDVSHDLVNIDEIINKSGSYYDDVDARQYPFPNMRVTFSESVWIACFVPSNGTPILAIQTGGYRYGNISKISVTLDYTKTTD